MRTIVQSRTYQLSATPNESNKEDKIDYSHALARPLEAAVLLDAITSVTGVPEKFELHRMVGGGDAPVGTRAMQTIADICPSQFMDDFGRSTRRALPAGHSTAELARGASHDDWPGLQRENLERRGETQRTAPEGRLRMRRSWMNSIWRL